MDKKFDLKEQFLLIDYKDKKKYIFDAQTNETNSYSVSYMECDGDEVNAWIIVAKAVKKNRPHLVLS